MNENQPLFVMRKLPVKIANWGNYPVIDAEVKSFTSVDEAQTYLQEANELIPRGLGRCYGDSALNQKILSTHRFNRILDFNPDTGEITCESGVSLAELVDIFVSRGWFLPVTPGTKFITVGGAIASDVHGKNHHIAGSFSKHVISMDVLLPCGEVRTCSKDWNSELFWATCGGMGMTGLVLKVTFNLVPIETAYIRQETIKCHNLDEIMLIFEESKDWSYSVAWIDCLSLGEYLGRSIMMRGEFAKASEFKGTKYESSPLKLPHKRNKTVPFTFPNFVLNNYTVRAFNYYYYKKTPNGVHESYVDFEEFFYPLDSIHHWNRIYGKRGFTQYQFVLPMETSEAGMKEILHKIAKSRQGSFLAVLKQFGEQNDLISFPCSGYTLALDFPITKDLFPLLDELDEMVLKYNGRIYLTKDVRMKEDTFKTSYRNIDRFLELKNQFDPSKKFQSFQTKRLGL